MAQPPTTTLLYRAIRLKCPRCGQAPMFIGWFRMHATCPACALKFEREPGYFLGSIYINYGLTALLTTLGWIVLRFGTGTRPGPAVMAGFALFCIGFPMFFFRYARALWLAMDCRFDKALFTDEADFPAA